MPPTVKIPDDRHGRRCRIIPTLPGAAVDLMLTVKDSAYDGFFRFRDAMIHDAGLRLRYQALKNLHSDHLSNEYRAAKDLFFRDLERELGLKVRPLNDSLHRPKKARPFASIKKIIYDGCQHMARQPVITIKNMSVTYHAGSAVEFPVLKDISLEIYKNEYVTFFGPSGSGKSTLLYVIAGLEVPTSESIVFNDEDRRLRQDLGDLTAPSLQYERGQPAARTVGRADQLDAHSRTVLEGPDRPELAYEQARDLARLL